MDNQFNSGYLNFGQPNQQQQQGQHQQHPQHPQQQVLGSFGNLSAQGRQPDSPSHPTLPPLQSQNAGFQFGSLSYGQPGSQAHTSTTSHAPSSTAPGHSNNAFAHPSSANPQSATMPPPSPFHQQPYPPLMYPTTTASMPPTSSVTLPNIRPMPPGGVIGPGGAMTGMANNGHPGNQPHFAPGGEDAPTHVVGSQGRRGILPSIPGRPNPAAQGSGQNAKSMIPQKDADGKFPCPHCNKTYLHAKHLKRHLLRHTGDRPYMCHLCKDTFSRSDILKRHFQKCSIRRGNPTGANHLAHQRRNTNGGHRLSISQQEGPIGLASLPEVADTSMQAGIHSPTANGDMSTRTSRTNSVITHGTMSHRNSVAGLGILGPSTQSGDQLGGANSVQSGVPPYNQPYPPTNGSSAGQMPSNYAFQNSHMNGHVFGNHGPPNSSPQSHQQQQQMPFLGQQSSRFDHSHDNDHQGSGLHGDGNSQHDWTRIFTQNGQDGFIGSQSANANSQAVQNVDSPLVR